MKRVREFILYNSFNKTTEVRPFTKYHAVQAGEYVDHMSPYDMPVSLGSALKLISMWNKEFQNNKSFVYWIEPTAIFEEE
jgi:hypothetical protein